MGTAANRDFSVGLPIREPTATGFGPVPDVCCVQGLKHGFSGWKSFREAFLERSQSAKGVWGRGAGPVTHPGSKWCRNREGPMLQA